ncbi:short-chain dehydrogenase, putative [Ixodes scapularis]|uniref:Short-chain dehydrogenase, putative n=1 Tax=Ixodes scapularis TaxID=6945 RepID=B7Q3A3_IXOSC|nr:short-chain dehydrogenase, putative [Ixodes scapularis]|eukprot:XP_002411201.1 short-chain dehydrogenase, putative [Ixodes scapularis]
MNSVAYAVYTENNDSVCEELRQLGHTAHAFQCDVTSEEQVEAVGNRVLGAVGRVDVLVNNAGVAMSKGLLALKHSQIRPAILRGFSV